MSAEDISRQTSNVLLPAEISREIWAKTLEESAIMQLARQIRIPGPGMKIQTITGEPVADWVEETAPKPVSTHTFGQKTITPYKLAVIEPFSEEFRRDKKALYAECVARLPKALSKKFDQTVMGTSSPGSGFDVLGSCTKQSILATQYVTVYDQFLTVDSLITTADGIMTGIALAPQGKSIVLGAVDSVGHPLFTPGVQSNTVGNILGAPVSIKKGVYKAGTAAVAASGTQGQEGYVAAVAGVPAIVGLAGDFDDALWGSVEGIKMSISDQATLSTTDGIIYLWQQNMFAVRFEIEVAFAVKNANEFVLLTGFTPTSA